MKSKIPVGFASLGEQRLKSITEPVRVYRVLLDPTAAGKTLPSRRRPPRRRLLAGIAAAVVLALAGAALWWQPWMAAKPPGPGERFAYPLPDRPSVAVLPFINVSGDTEHDHLAEGLTDDLITELSKVSGLFVIARHSVFAIQDSVGKIQDVAAELGVQYVLEGTLQRAGPRLRINVKLIDAVTGLSLWAERYDRQYADLFAVQDDVIGKIISALSVKPSARERDQLARIPTENLEAYDYYMRAEQEGFIFRDVDTYRRTLSFYQKAIDLDPGFANAHAESPASPSMSGATTIIISGRLPSPARLPMTPPGRPSSLIPTMPGRTRCLPCCNGWMDARRRPKIPPTWRLRWSRTMRRPPPTSLSSWSTPEAAGRRLLRWKRLCGSTLRRRRAFNCWQGSFFIPRAMISARSR